MKANSFSHNKIYLNVFLGRNYKKNCNGNGKSLVNRCRCNARFYGPECQYEDECETDDQCGAFGKCIDLKSSTYPKKQCFCSKGRFGAGCKQC